MLVGIMVVIVVIIVFIFIVIFWRNKKFNKVLLVRRVFRKRFSFAFRSVRIEWVKFGRIKIAVKFAFKEDVFNENCNNNSLGSFLFSEVLVFFLFFSMAFSTGAVYWIVFIVFGSFIF